MCIDTVTSPDLQPLPSFSPPHCESHCLFPWQPASLNKWGVLLFTVRCWDTMQGGKKMQINETTSCHEQACAHVLWMTLQIHAHFRAEAIPLVIHYSIKENQLPIILHSLQTVKCAGSTRIKGLPYWTWRSDMGQFQRKILVGSSVYIKYWTRVEVSG